MHTSGEPNLLAYSISKGGLMTLTRNLGDTLHRENGVRVNQINPGWVLTETEKKRKKEHGLPEDWYKDLPAYICSGGSHYYCLKKLQRPLYIGWLMNAALSAVRWWIWSNIPSLDEIRQKIPVQFLPIKKIKNKIFQCPD